MYDLTDRHMPTHLRFDDSWSDPHERLLDGGRLSHLVFVDGRLVDAWSESAEHTEYARIADRHDQERQPWPAPPPQPPRHQQMLEWLDAVAGGRMALLAMTATPGAMPRLADHLDPVADERWLIVDELLVDLREDLLRDDLAAPLREALLLARSRVPTLAERMSPDRLAGGLAWVVGKANGAIGPEGPVTQTRIADHLGTTNLGTSGRQVRGHIQRLTWMTPPPWQSHAPRLEVVGRVELLSAPVRSDLVDLRDRALAEAADFLPSKVES